MSLRRPWSRRSKAAALFVVAGIACIFGVQNAWGVYYASGATFSSTVPKTTASFQARTSNHISVFSAHPLALYYYSAATGTIGYVNTAGFDQLLLETGIGSGGNAVNARCQVTGGPYPVLGSCWTNGSA